MEFDEEKLKLVPEEEKRKFLLKGVSTEESNNIKKMNLDEFTKMREKETLEETEKYEKEAERIMNMDDSGSVIAPKAKRKRGVGAIELDKIRQKDPYATWRIFDIVLKKKQK